MMIIATLMMLQVYMFAEFEKSRTSKALCQVWFAAMCPTLKTMLSYEVEKGKAGNFVSHDYSILFCKVGQGRSLAMCLQWAAEASLVLSVT